LALGRCALVAEVDERRAELLVVLLGELQDVAELAERGGGLVAADVRRRAQLGRDLRERRDALGRDAQRAGRLADVRQLVDADRDFLREVAELLPQLSRRAGVASTVLRTPAQDFSNSMLAAMPAPSAPTTAARLRG
jgi:hypothetical protein